jgi:hypothetical protein
MVQKFAKNDPDENKFLAVWEAMLEGTAADLQEYFDNVDQSPELGTALSEAMAVEVWGLLEKSFFVKIFNELITAGYTSGAVDTYCRILIALFGEDTVIVITILNPLEINFGITAEYSQFTNWITQLDDKIKTQDGDQFVFKRLLTNIPTSQLYALLRAITSAGTKATFNFN